MHLTPDELLALLTPSGYPRTVTDVMIARLASTQAAPGDEVVIILDTQIWQTEMRPGRTAFSISRALARHIHDQLEAALAEIEQEHP